MKEHESNLLKDGEIGNLLFEDGETQGYLWEDGGAGRRYVGKLRRSRVRCWRVREPQV